MQPGEKSHRQLTITCQEDEGVPRLQRLLANLRHGGHHLLAWPQLLGLLVLQVPDGTGEVEAAVDAAVRHKAARLHNRHAAPSDSPFLGHLPAHIQN